MRTNSLLTLARRGRRIRRRIRTPNSTRRIRIFSAQMTAGCNYADLPRVIRASFLPPSQHVKIPPGSSHSALLVCRRASQHPLFPPAGTPLFPRTGGPFHFPPGSFRWHVRFGWPGPSHQHDMKSSHLARAKCGTRSRSPRSNATTADVEGLMRLGRPPRQTSRSRTAGRVRRCEAWPASSVTFSVGTRARMRRQRRCLPSGRSTQRSRQVGPCLLTECRYSGFCEAPVCAKVRTLHDLKSVSTAAQGLPNLIGS